MNTLSDFLLIFFLVFVAAVAFGATPEGRELYYNKNIKASVAESLNGEIRLLSPRPDTVARDIVIVSGETKSKSKPIVVEIKNADGEVLLSGTAPVKKSIFKRYKSWQKDFSLRSVAPDTKVFISASFSGDRSANAENVTVPIIVKQ